ncbi:MAG: polysaccharide biosynthesis/export family protein [Steroidobacteraceae bacterium]
MAINYQSELMIGVTKLRIIAALVLFLSVWVIPMARAQQLPDYRIHSGDEIEVAVWKEPDLLRKVIVRPDGKISFPLTGEIVAAGRTVMDIQTDIERLLKKYIPEPVITVSVTGLQGNQAYVIGQVNKPGSFMMNPQLNVLQALTLAGGMTPYAALNDIIILRGSGQKQQKLSFHYGDVSKGRALEQNVNLESGDVIIVP